MKPSQPLLARLRLTTKQVTGGYYKGNRTGSMGFFLKSSTYIIDRRKTREYMVPKSLPDFKLTPFVTKSFLPTRSAYTTQTTREGMKTYIPRALNGEDYLQQVIERNTKESGAVRAHSDHMRLQMAANNKKRQEGLARGEEKAKKKRKLKGGHTASRSDLREHRPIVPL